MSRWRTQNTINEDPDSRGLEVLAAGLWRCATSSLQIAFEEILDPPFKPCMHGSVIFTHVSQLKLSVRILREHNTHERQKLIRELFAGYNASSDFPGMAFVDDLIQIYPDMKIVLNKRSSAEEWEKSVRKSLKPFSTWWYAMIVFPTPQGYWHWRMYREYNRLAHRRFGKDIDIWTVRYYELHTAWVEHFVEVNAREILEWEPDMGWKSLCGFLNREIPERDFPRTNEQAEIEDLTKVLIYNGVAAWAVVVISIFIVFLYVSYLIRKAQI